MFAKKFGESIQIFAKNTLMMKNLKQLKLNKLLTILYSHQHQKTCIVVKLHSGFTPSLVYQMIVFKSFNPAIAIMAALSPHNLTSG